MQYIYSETIMKKPTSVEVYESRYGIFSILLTLLFIVNSLTYYRPIELDISAIENTYIETASEEVATPIEDITNITDEAVTTNDTTEQDVVENIPESIYAHTVEYKSKIVIKSPSKPDNCLDGNFNLSSQINTYSGLTKEEIQSITQDYPVLYNLSEDIYEMEKYNKINAFYTLGVASLESGYGKSEYAINKNNLCGLLKKNSAGEYVPIHFNTQRDSIVYFAELMRDYYIPNNLLTPENIQGVYEPRNNKWDDDVVSIMNTFANRYASIKK